MINWISIKCYNLCLFTYILSSLWEYLIFLQELECNS